MHARTCIHACTGPVLNFYLGTQCSLFLYVRIRKPISIYKRYIIVFNSVVPIMHIVPLTRKAF